MKWKKYTIETTACAEDILSEEIQELGACGAWIEDEVPLTKEELSGMFVDLPLELSGGDGTARISFFAEVLEEKAGNGSLESVLDVGADDVLLSLGGDNPRIVREKVFLAEIKNVLDSLKEFCDIGRGKITVTETENVDWENNWKQYWHAFSIDNVIIKPGWEELSGELKCLADKGAAVIDMDPGTAFGTGSHETTQLCIRALQKYVKAGDSVLDVGCGSGILGITACALGAFRVLATDLDEVAVLSTNENAKRNGVADKITAVKANIIDPKEAGLKETAGEGYDIVTANILAPVIIELQKIISPYMRQGAYFIASGILDAKEEEVLAAISKNPLLEVLEVNRQGEWVSIISRKIRERF